MEEKTWLSIKPADFISQLSGKSEKIHDVSWLNLFLERFCKDLSTADSFTQKMLRIFSMKVDGMNRDRLPSFIQPLTITEFRVENTNVSISSIDVHKTEQGEIAGYFDMNYRGVFFFKFKSFLKVAKIPLEITVNLESMSGRVAIFLIISLLFKLGKKDVHVRARIAHDEVLRLVRGSSPV